MALRRRYSARLLVAGDSRSIEKAGMTQLELLLKGRRLDDGARELDDPLPKCCSSGQCTARSRTNGDGRNRRWHCFNFRLGIGWVQFARPALKPNARFYNDED